MKQEKTIKEWLMLIKDEEIRKNALIYLGEKVYIRKSFQEALMSAFYWDVTDEGYDFWRNIHENYKHYIEEEEPKDEIEDNDIIGKIKSIDVGIVERNAHSLPYMIPIPQDGIGSGQTATEIELPKEEEEMYHITYVDRKSTCFGKIVYRKDLHKYMNDDYYIDSVVKI